MGVDKGGRIVAGCRVWQWVAMVSLVQVAEGTCAARGQVRWGWLEASGKLGTLLVLGLCGGRQGEGTG